jgi:hypothetical protein
MFGSNHKQKRSFRQTYRGFLREGGGTGTASGTGSGNNSSPTEQAPANAADKLSAAKLSANAAAAASGFNNSNKAKQSMLRIRSPFGGKKAASSTFNNPLSPVRRPQHKSPRNLGGRSPLGISTSSNSRSHNRVAVASPLSPVGEQKLRMMPKIAAYRTKGYLTATQERDLFAQLEQSQNNPFDNSAVKRVEQQLEIYKSQSFAAGSFDSSGSDISKISSKASSSGNKSASRMAATIVVPEDQKLFLRLLLQKENARKTPTKNIISHEKHKVASKTSLFDKAVKQENQQEQGFDEKTSFFDQGFDASKETNVFNQQQEPSLFDQAEVEEEELFEEAPRPYSEIPLNDRVILSSANVFDKLDGDFLENLFVEMCFYARLGFMQPPTCLRCLYMEAMEGMDQDVDCQNWVIWRKDANVILHPHSMDDNLCVVQCQAARRLVEGEEVQDHTWDTIKRQVVQKER